MASFSSFKNCPMNQDGGNMPTFTPAVMQFNERLGELVRVGDKTRLAANQAMANPAGADDETRRKIIEQANELIGGMNDLRLELEVIGRQ